MNIEERISEYEEVLSLLRQTMFEDDPDWKSRAENLIKMLVEDRVEVLKNKKDLLASSVVVTVLEDSHTDRDGVTRVRATIE